MKTRFDDICNLKGKYVIMATTEKSRFQFIIGKIWDVKKGYINNSYRLFSSNFFLYDGTFKIFQAFRNIAQTLTIFPNTDDPNFYNIRPLTPNECKRFNYMMACISANHSPTSALKDNVKQILAYRFIRPFLKELDGRKVCIA